MRPLTLGLRRKSIRDPAPSKWRYRWQRWMLTPGVRAAIRIGTPLILIAVIAATWFSDPANRAQFERTVAEARNAIAERPEFLVTGLRVDGGDGRITADVERVLRMEFPVSSFDLDLEELRRTVAALNAVGEASVRVGEAGVLVVDVTPRVPVAIWRERQTLKLLDAEGHFTGVIEARGDRRDLPLIAGDGAKDHIAEALALFQTAAPIGDRVRGLVRMGERRWDMVLDRGQRVLLPEDGAVAAIDRVIALDEAQDLLDRDVVVVDMRNPDRPTVRMNAEAAAAMRRVSETRTSE